MITDEDHPAFLGQTRALHGALRRFLGRPLTGAALREIDGTLRAHRAAARRAGVDFPAMVALVVPRLGWIKLARADLDAGGVRQTVLNLIAERPEVEPWEIREALRRAWRRPPPGVLVDEVEGRVRGIES